MSSSLWEFEIVTDHEKFVKIWLNFHRFLVLISGGEWCYENNVRFVKMSYGQRKAWRRWGRTSRRWCRCSGRPPTCPFLAQAVLLWGGDWISVRLPSSIFLLPQATAQGLEGWPGSISKVTICLPAAPELLRAQLIWCQSWIFVSPGFCRSPACLQDDKPPLGSNIVCI